MARNNFNIDFKNLLNEKGFILYISNIFFKYLNYFCDKKNIIPKESLNLFFESDFISTIINTYSSYKKSIKNFLESITEEKSKEFIDIQAKMEKAYGNMNIGNKRDLNEFKKISTIFLQNNYNFFVQHYIINFLIQPDNHFDKFLSSITEEFKKTINLLSNFNSNDPNGKLIKKHLEICLKRKLNSFSQFNGLEITENKFPIISYNPKEIKLIDENLEKYFENQDSIILYKNKNINYNKIEENEIRQNWFNCKDNNWKLLREELKGKIKNFMENIKYQISSIDMNKMDKTFIFLQEEIKKDLINFLNNNLSNYIKEIYSNYNYKIFKDCYNSNDIEQIIMNENMEAFYKQKICESLKEYSKNPDSKKIEYLSIILTGRSGIGKSTLINCLFKEYVAEEGIGDIITRETKPYSSKNLPFFKLTDTRGYELNIKNAPEKIKNEVLNNIQSKKEKSFLERFRGIWNYLTGNEDVENKDFKEYYHCIWFCVNGNDLDESDKNALKQLKENKHNLPVIVVFTRGKRDNEIN